VTAAGFRLSEAADADLEAELELRAYSAAHAAVTRSATQASTFPSTVFWSGGPPRTPPHPPLAVARAQASLNFDSAFARHAGSTAVLRSAAVA
jgi:hypothetical protein